MQHPVRRPRIFAKRISDRSNVVYTCLHAFAPSPGWELPTMSTAPEEHRPPRRPTLHPATTLVGTIFPRSVPATAAGLQALSTLPLPPEPAAAVPISSGYEILGTLGQGGMGIVYLARQNGLNRLVALKVFYAASPQVFRFYAEAQLLAAMQHPGVVQVYEL